MRKLYFSLLIAFTVVILSASILRIVHAQLVLSTEIDVLKSTEDQYFETNGEYLHIQKYKYENKIYQVDAGDLKGTKSYRIITWDIDEISSSTEKK